MNEVKHTPERWKLAENDRTLVVTEVLDADGNCEIVADVVTSSGPITAKHYERARLIASAPELKDALAAMLDFWGGYECPEVDAAIAVMQEIGEDRWSMQAQMDAAKAKGLTP